MSVAETSVALKLLYCICKIMHSYSYYKSILNENKKNASGKYWKCVLPTCLFNQRSVMELFCNNSFNLMISLKKSFQLLTIFSYKLTFQYLILAEHNCQSDPDLFHTSCFLKHSCGSDSIRLCICEMQRILRIVRRKKTRTQLCAILNHTSILIALEYSSHLSGS